MEEKLKTAVVGDETAAADNLPVEKEKASEQASKTPLQEFLDNPDNRRAAGAHALNLWKICTKNRPIEDAPERVFHVTEVVHATTLSHSKAKELFNVLRTFGYLRNVDKTHFVLVFDKMMQLMTIEAEAVTLVSALSDDIARYKSVLASNTELTEEQRKKKYDDFKERMLNSILL